MQKLVVATRASSIRLPVQLKYLKVEDSCTSWVRPAGIGVTLTELESVNIVWSQDTAQDLLLLGTLNSLPHLSIRYLDEICYMSLLRQQQHGPNSHIA